MVFHRLRAGRFLLGQPLFSLEKFLLALQGVLITLFEGTHLFIKAFFALRDSTFGLEIVVSFAFCSFSSSIFAWKTKSLASNLALFDKILCFALGRMDNLHRLILSLHSAR